jgi:rare lipoprotein A
MRRFLFIFLISFISVEWACTPYPRYRAGAWANEASETAKPEKKSESTEQAEPEAIPNRIRATDRGIASFMADETHGRKTANGEMYDMRQLVAAHLTLPFGTIVLVRNVKNGKEVEVRINDRGPYVKGRIIDLSLEAAKRIGLAEQGSGLVEIEVLKVGR